MAREVLTGVAAARKAADNLVRRLEKQLGEAKATIACLRSQLDCGSRGDPSEAEALRREAIARPALVARVRGRPETKEQRKRRNVAWHAERCPSAGAPPREWRRAERGPRLLGGPFPRDKGGSGGDGPGAIFCEVEVCVAEPAIVLPRWRTPLRSRAQPFLPSWTQSLQTADAVSEIMSEKCGACVPSMEFPGAWVPVHVGASSGDRAEPGPPRGGVWKADVGPLVGGAAGAGTPPPPLPHTGGPDISESSGASDSDPELSTADSEEFAHPSGLAAQEYLWANPAALFRGGGVGPEAVGEASEEALKEEVAYEPIDSIAELEAQLRAAEELLHNTALAIVVAQDGDGATQTQYDELDAAAVRKVALEERLAAAKETLGGSGAAEAQHPPPERHNSPPCRDAVLGRRRGPCSAETRSSVDGRTESPAGRGPRSAETQSSVDGGMGLVEDSVAHTTPDLLPDLSTHDLQSPAALSVVEEAIDDMNSGLTYVQAGPAEFAMLDRRRREVNQIVRWRRIVSGAAAASGLPGVVELLRIA